IATEDHNIPTVGSIEPIVDPVSRAQVEALRANAPEFGVPPLGDADQGVVH
ncbi:MAG TPA: 2-methylmalate dehydratase, partial [Cutibacterium acnes]|nr:2-methylmalate dehydratase [Cutibacterium acnes]